MYRYGIFFLIAMFMLCSAHAENMVGDSQQQTYTVKSGDNLEKISTDIYGNRHYSKVLALHNHINNSTRLKVGTTLNTPPLNIILFQEGLAPIMKDEIAYITQAKEWYMNVEKTLHELRMDIGYYDKVDVPDDVKNTLTMAVEHLDKAIKGLSTQKEGVRAIPQKMVNQLQKVSSNLRELAEGTNDGYGYDLDMVHQRLVHAMLNGIKWARNGYK